MQLRHSAASFDPIRRLNLIGPDTFWGVDPSAALDGVQERERRSDVIVALLSPCPP